MDKVAKATGTTEGTIRTLLEERVGQNGKFEKTISTLLSLSDEDLDSYWGYGLERCSSLSEYNKRKGNEYGNIASPVDWILSCTSRFLYTDWLLVKQTREAKSKELAEQEAAWRKRKEEQLRAKENAKPLTPRKLRDVLPKGKG